MKYLTIDVAMAFIIAMLFNMFGFIGNNIKNLLVLICGGTICVIYILNDFQINFIGIIDFGVWIVCIIVFNIIIEYVLNKAKHVQQ